LIINETLPLHTHYLFGERGIALFMVTLILLTRNAGNSIRTFLQGLNCQSLRLNLLLIDSNSTDDTVTHAMEAGFRVHRIMPHEFNHGTTRQMGVVLSPDADFYIFMTQDAILASPDSIKNILKPFKDERIGAVCGRQLPHEDALSIAAHARIFNYPAKSSIKSKDDISSSGIKAAFISNSFSAYRRNALVEVGGFPSDVIFGEDTYVATKMLLAGWKIAYAAEATCYHSHNYSIKEEFERYFDIGVFHSREKWFIESLGKPTGEGKKFVVSELKYLLNRNPWLIPSSCLRTSLKYLGYKLGQNESALPLWLKCKISMNKGFWL